MKCSYSERRLTLGLWQATVLKVDQGASSEFKEPSCGMNRRPRGQFKDSKLPTAANRCLGELQHRFVNDVIRK